MIGRLIWNQDSQISYSIRGHYMAGFTVETALHVGWMGAGSMFAWNI